MEINEDLMDDLKKHFEAIDESTKKFYEKKNLLDAH